MHPGQADFRRAFELSPITLVGGIAGNMAGGALPILSLLNPGNLVAGSNIGLDSAFGSFHPLPGSSLIENQLGDYPFANQAVAANAIVKQPLNVSLLLTAPVNSDTTYRRKLAIMTSLQATLANHCAQGGLFIVATPSFYYNNCILVGLHDVSGGETAQGQFRWRFDFRRPLIALEQAGPAMNTFMQRLSSGAMAPDAFTGRNLATPRTVGAPGLLPLAASVPSAGIPAQPV